jgi:ubiquinone/menaquinone biosynthesis C-methylase UbiE
MSWDQFASRKQKAQKIKGILVDFLGVDSLERLRCLDVGCGSGEITHILASEFEYIVGLDYFPVMISATEKESDAHFLQADGTRLPFSSAYFDVVICAQVYEHTNLAERLPGEINRVLKSGGICFFSGPNRCWPIEMHYKLPIIQWLPIKIANIYLRVSGRGDVFDIRSYTYWRLRRLWEEHFLRYDRTLALLEDPDRFGFSDPSLRYARLIPFFVFKLLYFVLPNYNWILVKRNEKEDIC